LATVKCYINDFLTYKIIKMTTKIYFTLLFSGLIFINSYSQKIVWNTKAELPNKCLSGSAVTCQEKIYFIVGQIDSGSGNPSASNLIYEYNLAMDEWIKKPNMPTARWNFATASIEGKIYAIGGDSFLDKNEMYNPTTESWQALAPMPTARQHIKATVVNNKIYIIGGLESWSKVSTKNQVYDPLTNTWQEKAPIPTPKHNYSTVVYNDKIYIYGGNTKNGENIWLRTSTVDVYDPATNTWDTSASLPTTRIGSGIGLISNMIFIVGGLGDGDMTRVDFFDPATGLWSQSNPLPKKNVHMGSAVLNNKIYIIGGTDGPGNWTGYSTVYEGTFE
jgi:N-acetylneuraminic acid mutarotase